MHRKNKKFRKISLIAPTSENEVLSSLVVSSASLLIEERTCEKVQKRNFICSASCGIFIDLFSKLRSNKESFNNIVHHRAIFRRNKRFNVSIFISDYKLRWWRLPIEERACR